MNSERINLELAKLSGAGTTACLRIDGDRPLVLYSGVPTAGAERGLPADADVVVPVPDGYPASMIDLAGLPIGSPFLSLVRGGLTPQGIVTLEGVRWQLASYHPHQNGGGPPWDMMRHGFHTYLDHLIAWLHRLN
jgi:hypothetical protein